MSVFHVQPASLSQGYETTLPHAYLPYQNSQLKTKMKSMSSRCKELANWFAYSKTRDEKKLYQAVSMNDTATITRLLNQGVSASCYDSQRRSPLHMASCKGYAHIVKLLLDHGADPNARDSIGNTPLHLAACTNHINVVLLLLKAGTIANSIDHLGQSPLQLARSKLKILQRSKIPDAEIKAQVSQVIEMLLYFEKLGASKSIESVDTELLTRFQDQLKTVDSREQVDNQLKELLDNLGSLSIAPS
ncbi:ankyrin repeat domain-containing protein 54 isoform X2 [Rhodnius prolixus]